MITDNEIQQLGWTPTGKGYTLAGHTISLHRNGYWYFYNHNGVVFAKYRLPNKARLETLMGVYDIQKPLFTNPEEHLV